MVPRIVLGVLGLLRGTMDHQGILGLVWLGLVKAILAHACTHVLSTPWARVLQSLPPSQIMARGPCTAAVFIGKSFPEKKLHEIISEGGIFMGKSFPETWRLFYSRKDGISGNGFLMKAAFPETIHR